MQRAFRINPDLSLAHHLYTHFEVDAGRSLEAMVRLLGRVRGCSSDPELYAGLLHACRYVGLLDASMAAYRRATRLDPAIRTSIAHSFFMSGDFERAIELDVDDPPYLTSSRAACPRTIGARRWTCADRRASAVRRNEQLKLLMNAIESVLEGDTEEGRIAVARLQSAHGPSRIPRGCIYWAHVAAGLGDIDTALGLLSRAVDTGFYCVRGFEISPLLAVLRPFPAFDRHPRTRPAPPAGCGEGVRGRRRSAPARSAGRNALKSHAVAREYPPRDRNACGSTKLLCGSCAPRRAHAPSIRLVSSLRSPRADGLDPAPRPCGSHHDCSPPFSERGLFMIGDRLLRVSHHAFVILLVVASAIVLTAQTVVDPRYVEFTPSADHNTLAADGTPLVQRYSLSVFVVGSSVAVRHHGPRQARAERRRHPGRLSSPPAQRADAERGLRGARHRGWSRRLDRQHRVERLFVPGGLCAIDQLDRTIGRLRRDDRKRGRDCRHRLHVVRRLERGLDHADRSHERQRERNSAIQRRGEYRTRGAHRNADGRRADLHGESGGGGLHVRHLVEQRRLPAAGGTGSTNVTSSAGCPWSAVSNNTWITVTSGASGSGNGSVGFTVAANPNTVAANRHADDRRADIHGQSGRGRVHLHADADSRTVAAGGGPDRRA